MNYYTREDSHQMREIIDILRKNNVPYRLENTQLGLQLRFDWSDGDVVCHYGTSHMPESYQFPWDNGDVTRDAPASMANRIVNHYRVIKGEKPAFREYRVCIDYDVTIAAEDEEDALNRVLADLGNGCKNGKLSIELLPDQRQQWIDNHYEEAKDVANSTDCYDGKPLAHIRFCKDTTIFVRHWISDNDDIGIAAPRHGDKYDRKTGIAVAYAKAMGEAVPDYI